MKKQNVFNRIGFSKLIPGIGKRALTPGTVQYVGVKRLEKVEIDVVEYSPDFYKREKIGSIDELEVHSENDCVTWVNFTGVHDLDIVKRTGEKFGIRSLTLEDITNTTQRTRVDFQRDYVFFVMKAIGVEVNEGGLSMQQLSIVLGKNFVLTFFEEPHDFLEPLVKRIENSMGKIRILGSDYLMFAIMNIVLENYFFAIQKIAEITENIEIGILEDERAVSEHELYRIRRRLIFMVKPSFPLKEGIYKLLKSEHSVINTNTSDFFNELYDQASHLNETLSSLNEIVAGLFDFYFSVISNRTNRIMKVLTVFASIFIPLTFLAGVYGMNFKYIPELGLDYGYFIFWGISVFMVIVMVFIFRKLKIF